MTTVSQVDAVVRNIAGTGQARAVRRQGLVPGIIYGGEKAPAMCAIEAKFLGAELGRSGFFTKVYTLSIDGKTEQVMAKDVQFHPVSDKPLHIDFIRVGKNTRVTVAVPIRYINEDKAPGIKRGGVMTVLVRDLEVQAPVTSIPEEIVVDLTGLEIHASLHLDAIQFGAGVTAAHPERDYTLVTITAPTSDTASSDTASAE